MREMRLQDLPPSNSQTPRWVKIVAIAILVFILPACTRTIPWRFDTIDNALPPARPLPNHAHYWDIPLRFDVVWDAAGVFMRQSKQWKVVTEDKASGLIRAKVYKTENRIEFVQVNVKEIGPTLTEVRTLSLSQESCEIFTFVHYAFKPIIWVATLGWFLLWDISVGMTAHELQRDRNCEERAVLHPDRLGEYITGGVWHNLEAAGLLTGPMQMQMRREH